ncbi:PAS domain-containing sensor histidine kinase [Solidesulfovibrio sp.]|uniref:PAS domain-containing sensor histidine kinase n=1 Tax=Solidesulfovibrio sp. TaxID=2910990 RepID=UPI002B20BB81|nr:response regulator [Solidesulfovibrio sp.]MEA5090836.1 response regulator [Solidesulfovibrio sp.]
MPSPGMLECTCEQILQFAPVSVMLIDAEGVISFVNDWHLAHFAKGKWDRDHYIGKKIQELPGIVSAGVSDDIRAILDGRTIHLEAFYTDACSGGQSAYQNLRGTPIRKDGMVVGGIVIREDVTELVMSQHLLSENQAIFKTLLDATHDSIILSDLDGYILIANEEAARRRGKTVDALMGASLYQSMSAALAETRRERLLEAACGNRLLSYEERQGEQCCQVSLCPIADDKGRVILMASYSRDITALKETENQLRREKELAFSASQAKSQFLGNITHELRTPLNGIIGATQLALQGDGQDDQRELWNIVEASGKRLLAIVNNVLELADIDAAAIEPMLSAFDVDPLIASLARGYSVRAKVKELGFSVRFDPHIPRQLVGDAFRLRQILSNLLDNALKCTKSGSIELRVKRIATSRLPVASNYRTLLFMVRDTGIGIAKECQHRIFEDFELAEHYLTKRVSGAGVGLAIARHLTEMLGGKIWVKSAPGQGSTFYCAIPFALPEYACQGLPVVYQSGDGGDAAFDPADHTVLLVEDERINRLTTGRTLERLGYHVLEAANGQEALALLSRETADIILMDIQMPVMDGIECTRHIRNGEVPRLSKAVPIVALTAYASGKDRDRFLRLGMNDYLAKPHSIEQLGEVLEANLKAASGGEAETRA